jgi:hypothetical protein
MCTVARRPETRIVVRVYIATKRALASWNIQSNVGYVLVFYSAQG